MSNYDEAEINFSSLWNQVPKPRDTVWKLPRSGRGQWDRWREVVELLCGALWHFEQASKLAAFSRRPLREIREEKGLLPWELWLYTFQSPAEQTAGVPSSSGGDLHASAGDRINVLIQSMLLADGALRLAGAWAIAAAICGRGTEPLFNPESVLTPAGDIEGSGRPGIETYVLIVMAFRDSFMHGELSDRGGSERIKKRKLFRDKWFTGELKPPLDYSLAVIAEACKEVWERLLHASKIEMQKLLAHKKL